MKIKKLTYIHFQLQTQKKQKVAYIVLAGYGNMKQKMEIVKTLQIQQ